MSACLAWLTCLSTNPASAEAWLGFLEGPATPSPNLAKVERAATCLEVRLVLPSGPADKAGLKRGDVLLEIGAEDVADENALASALDDLKAGQTVRVAVWRAERRIEVTATADSLPEPKTMMEAVRRMDEAGCAGAATALGRLIGKGGTALRRTKLKAFGGCVRPQSGAMWRADGARRHVRTWHWHAERLDRSNRWSRKAAEQGDAIAQYNLAMV